MPGTFTLPRGDKTILGLAWGVKYPARCTQKLYVSTIFFEFDKARELCYDSNGSLYNESNSRSLSS